MKKFIICLAAIGAMACSVKPLEVELPVAPEIDDSIYAAGTIAVKFTSGSSAAVSTKAESGVTGFVEIDDILAEAGVCGIERIWKYSEKWEDLYDEMGINRWYAIYYSDAADTRSLIDRLSARGEVECISRPVARRFMKVQGERTSWAPIRRSVEIPTKAAAPMNDPFLRYQWWLHNTGWLDKYFEKGPVSKSPMNIVDAWKLCKGDPSVTVAVFDEAVYTGHPDLEANIWRSSANASEHGRNFYNKNKTKLDWKWEDAYEEDGIMWYDYSDHGTHVAGVIAAVNNNDLGVSSIAGGNGKANTGVKIMSCQILGDPNADYDDYGTSRAYQYALENGAVIAQNSWGYSFDTEKEAKAFITAWENNAYSDVKLMKESMETFIKGAGRDGGPSRGGLIFFAAGNDGDVMGELKSYPSAWDQVIAVGSTSWWLTPAYYSCYGKWVDICAPGGDGYTAFDKEDRAYYANSEVYSTVLCDNSMNFMDDRKDEDDYGYGYMQGTSMACPQVSGVAALGLSYAAKLGKTFTADEFRSLLLSSVTGVEDRFVGVRSVEGWTMDNSSYKGKLGGGMVDALKLLIAVRGIPMVCVKAGEANAVKLSSLVGGDGTAIKFGGISFDSSLDALEAATSYDNSKGVLTITPAKEGLAIATIRATVGDTPVSREVAVVSRENLASNGAWL